MSKRSDMLENPRFTGTFLTECREILTVSYRDWLITSTQRRPIAQQLFSRPPCQSSASALSSSKCKTSELVEAFRHFRMFRQEGGTSGELRGQSAMVRSDWADTPTF